MKHIQGKQIVDMAAQAGKLSADQKNAWEQKKLVAKAVSYIQRVYIPNQGTANGIPLYNDLSPKAIGLNSLELNCKMPEAAIITGFRANVAVLAASANQAAITNEVIKAADFNNLTLNLGLTTVRIPSLLSASQFQLDIRGNTSCTIPVKDFLVLGNQKNYAEASEEDVVDLPNGLEVLKQNDTLKPLLLMPEGSLLSDPAFGVGSKQYLWETIYLGYSLVIMP